MCVGVGVCACTRVCAWYDYEKIVSVIQFKLDIQTNLKITDYLDVTLNLYNGTVSLFRKRKQYPCYINGGSNHSRQVLKHIPNNVMVRLSTNSSNIDIFPQNKHKYEASLKNSGIKAKFA